MNDIDIGAIQFSAERTLKRSSGNRFDGSTLTDSDISCIAEAISEAIKEYDNQRNEN